MDEKWEYLLKLALKHTVVIGRTSVKCNSCGGDFIADNAVFYLNRCRWCRAVITYVAASHDLYDGDKDPRTDLSGKPSDLTFIGYILKDGSLLPPLQIN